jgi:hypothetical protein
MEEGYLRKTGGGNSFHRQAAFNEIKSGVSSKLE